MKKILKRIFIGIGIIILLIVLFLGAYMMKARSEMKKMTTTETGQIVENVFSIQDSFANFYLLKDNDKYIAIDAGNNTETISEELKKLNINPDDIEAVLLTHTDRDHVAAIKLFKNAEVYLSKEEEQLLNGEKSRFIFVGNKIDSEQYTLIVDQQVFYIGNIKVEGILTPGHTPGSMCYLIDDKYLFTGDALSLKEGQIAPFNKFFNMDTRTALSSMEKISNIPEADYIFTAHYGYSNDYNFAVKDWEN